MAIDRGPVGAMAMDDAGCLGRQVGYSAWVLDVFDSGCDRSVGARVGNFRDAGGDRVEIDLTAGGQSASSSRMAMISRSPGP